ncbi:unnamed protein product [Caenorhabditis angaria]|uniref:Uncharacterized protein n=1 Tax=Caenorhabditis angaria TaxID=860376 RepID=A0A9P1MUN8_9PELO|nr:unnamed protein product [Caenorhabditis angaria]
MRTGGLLQIFKDFSNWSTVAVVPHIANATHKISRAFWIIVFLFVLGMFIYELYIVISKFFSYPATVNTEIFFEKLAFPVVSICNMNPYKYSKVQSTSAFSNFNSLMTAYKNAMAGSYSGDSYGFSETSGQSYDLDARAYDAQILEAYQISDAQKEPALYTFADLVQDCTFAGSPCSSSDFTRYIDPVYGACYSFNSDKSLNFSVSRQGIQFGLKMVITVGQTLVNNNNDFLPTTKQAGARVGILARGVLPGLDNNGIDVGVGSDTAISISYTQNIRAKKPYGKCVDREPTSTDYYQNYTYTLETCFEGCKQRDTVKHCSCANPRFALGASDTACQPNKNDLDCLQTLKGNQTNSADPNIDLLTECSCNPPCNEDTYSTTVSFAKFPATKYYVAVSDDSTIGSCTTSSKFSSQTACQNWYSSNGLILQVFFATLSYEVYTETSGYTIGNIINDLGGQAGLWLGLSVISCVEMTGLLLVMCGFAAKGGKVKINPDDDDFEGDHRIKDVEDVKKELDHMEKNHKDMGMDSDLDDEIENDKKIR